MFNCRKSEFADGQIGDRRSLNLIERSVPGPSNWVVCGIVLCPKAVLVASVTDCPDFYHQIMITPQRAESNAVGFRLPISVAQSFRNAGASLGRAQRENRKARGDDLYKSSSAAAVNLLLQLCSPVSTACFKVTTPALSLLPRPTKDLARQDLVLPQDVMNTQQFALLRIDEPKTRRRSAKH